MITERKIKMATNRGNVPRIKENDKDDLIKILEESLDKDVADFEAKIEAIEKAEKEKAEKKRIREEAEQRRILKRLIENGDEEKANTIAKKATAIIKEVKNLQQLIDNQKYIDEEKPKDKRHYVALSTARVAAFERIFPADKEFSKLPLHRVANLGYMFNAMPRMIFELINLYGSCNIYELCIALRTNGEQVAEILRNLIEIGLVVKTTTHLSKDYINEFKLELASVVEKNYRDNLILSENKNDRKIAYYSVNKEVVEILNLLNDKLKKGIQESKKLKIADAEGKLTVWQKKRKYMLEKGIEYKVKDFEDLNESEDEE